MKSVFEIIQTRRTFRGFRQEPLPAGLLERIVDAARLAPSSANRQFLKFATVAEPAKRDALFELTRWAGYIPDHGGQPQPGRRPAAFAVLLHDTSVSQASPELDAGAAAENMMLAAWAEGVGSCWIGSVDRKAAAELLGLPEHLQINTVIAFGYPDHASVVEDAAETIRYRRDEDGTYHVPKRPLEEVWLQF